MLKPYTVISIRADGGHVCQLVDAKDSEHAKVIAEWLREPDAFKVEYVFFGWLYNLTDVCPGCGYVSSLRDGHCYNCTYGHDDEEIHLETYTTVE